MAQSNRNKNLLLIATGIAVGAAAGYYANSKSGKKLTSQLVDKSSELRDTVSSKIKETANTTSDYAKSTVDTAKNKAQEAVKLARNSVQSGLNYVSETLDKISPEATIENSADSVKNGVKKAKKKINETVSGDCKIFCV